MSDQVWIVWDHDWVTAEITVHATFWTKAEADAYTDEHWGHGYGVTAVPLPPETAS